MARARADQSFVCPHCSGGLKSSGSELRCVNCERRYPIRGGIPRFVGELSDNVAQIQRVFAFEHARYKDSWYTRFGPELIDQYLQDCQLPREFFDGKRVLDAGCGSGRWTFALSELANDVVGFDLTEPGVEAAWQTLHDRGNVSIGQGNLFSPPVAQRSFDFVMSWGVLHHTPNTLAAFRSIVPLVTPGGTLYIMVYRRGPRLAHWGTEVLRLVMRRLSDEQRYRACRRLVIRRGPLADLVNLLFMIAPYDASQSDIDTQTLQFGLFDAYSPRYNFTHTADEVVGWFQDAGFDDVEVLDAPSLKVRGVKA